MGGDVVDATGQTNVLTADTMGTEAKCLDVDNDGLDYDGP
jgi:hypothetical protein